MYGIRSAKGMVLEDPPQFRSYGFPYRHSPESHPVILEPSHCCQVFPLGYPSNFLCCTQCRMGFGKTEPRTDRTLHFPVPCSCKPGAGILHVNSDQRAGIPIDDHRRILTTRALIEKFAFGTDRLDFPRFPGTSRRIAEPFEIHGIQCLLEADDIAVLGGYRHQTCDRFAPRRDDRRLAQAGQMELAREVGLGLAHRRLGHFSKSRHSDYIDVHVVTGEGESGPAWGACVPPSGVAQVEQQRILRRPLIARVGDRR